MGESNRSRNDLDVGRSSFGGEVRRRAPWMMLAVIAGTAMVWIGQTYEEAMAERIELVFFLPMIVYMSDSIGTETLTLFVRELSDKDVNLHQLFFKETLVGFTLGLISGIPMGLISYVWMQDIGVAFVVATAMTINGVVAVLVGMLIPIAFARFKLDPALGTDEITTALSDNISLLVYLLVATLVLFSA